MSSIDIIYKLQLTRELIDSISSLAKDEIMEEMWFNEDYTTDKYLADRNFVLFKIKCNDIVYYMIHGFPGDNTSGIVWDDKKVIVCLGELNDITDESHEIEKWYYNLHKNNDNPQILYI